MRISFRGGLKKKTDGFATKKKPRFPSVCSRRSVYRNVIQMLIFFRGRQQKENRGGSAEKTRQVPGVCSWRQNAYKVETQIRFFFEAARNEKRDGFAAEEKKLSSPAFVCGEMRTRSRFRCATSTEGGKKKPKDGFAKKTPTFRGFFCGEMCTRPYFKFAFSSEGAKEKKQRWFCGKKNASASGFFWRRNAYHVRIRIRIFASGREKNPGTLRSFFSADWAQKSKTQKYPQPATTLVIYKRPFFTPSPLKRTNLYDELVGKSYFAGRFFFFVKPLVLRRFPLLF